MDKFDVIEDEVSPDEFCDVMGLSTAELVEAFKDRIDKQFYYLDLKYKQVTKVISDE